MNAEKATLFDYTGVSMQSVVDKQLFKAGKVWRDLIRWEFIEKVWELKEVSPSSVSCFPHHRNPLFEGYQDHITG